MAAPAHATEEGARTLPRFASLKSAEVNVRAGPGTRYPIQWIYRHGGLPVEIVEEFDQWRKIRDVEGSAGWVHKTMLDGRRTALIQSKEPCIFRAEPSTEARMLFKAAPRVAGRVRRCQDAWCELEVAGRRGWIEKTHLWGVGMKEVFK